MVQRTAGPERPAVHHAVAGSLQPHWRGERRAAQRRTAVSRVARTRRDAFRSADPAGPRSGTTRTPSGGDRRAAPGDAGNPEPAVAVLRAPVPRERGRYAGSERRGAAVVRARRRVVSAGAVAASGDQQPGGACGKSGRSLVVRRIGARAGRGAVRGRSVVELLHLSVTRPRRHRDGAVCVGRGGAEMKAAFGTAALLGTALTAGAQQATFSSRVDAVRVDVLVRDRGQ